MGVSIYIPALALNAVTPLDLKWTIILTSLVCTFYTCLVSLKNFYCGRLQNPLWRYHLLLHIIPISPSG